MSILFNLFIVNRRNKSIFIKKFSLKKILFFILFNFFIFYNACAFPIIKGDVIRVIDGDTVDIYSNKKLIRIRLSDIDAPEYHQEFGPNSKRALSKMILRKKVEIIDKGFDKYGRTIGTIFIRKKNVNEIMIQKGMAWAYKNHGKLKNKKMKILEKKARIKKIGLWINENPKEPWKWRHDKKY